MLVEYNGRLVDSDNFRVVLHDSYGNRCVAEGWDAYQNLLNSGDWVDHLSHVSRETSPPKKRRAKRKGVNDGPVGS